MHTKSVHLHYFVCNVFMERYLKRLSELILYEMGRKNQSCICFAELCGLSRNELSAIVNRKKKDLRLSTIVSICENSDIQIEDIFCDKSNEIPLKNAFMIISGTQYRIELKEYE